MYKLLSHEHNTFAIDDNTFLPNATELRIFKLSVSRLFQTLLEGPRMQNTYKILKIMIDDASSFLLIMSLHFLPN